MGGQDKLKGWDDWFLKQRVAESLAIIKDVAKRSTYPLILQFSGGRDSMAMLGLVREAGVEDFVACYMATGLEFRNVVQFVRQTCRDLGVPLLVSTPGMYKGNLFKRAEDFHRFPNIIGQFCCRDLKLRPQKTLLRKTFGPKAHLYKLIGVRRFESSRRKWLYLRYCDNPIRPDGEHKGAFEVFPILSWSDDDVKNYIQLQGLPTSTLYRDWGVSGCSWCPFYGAEIYLRVLRHLPNHYDRIIALEEKLGQPSVLGQVWLRDLKKQVMEGVNHG